MGSKASTEIEYCEHGEMRVACLECLAMPRKVTPQPTAAPRATKNPTSESDKISPLGGELDMSLPVEVVEPLIGADWLMAHTFPHYLRRSGWIYLRHQGRLRARVKVMKVVWRIERKVPTDGPFEDLGPGLALQVDPRTWDDAIDIDLGDLAAHQQHGYRYLLTNEDDTVTHYRGGRPVTGNGRYEGDLDLD
jgi:hypothetical protein